MILILIIGTLSNAYSQEESDTKLPDLQLSGLRDALEKLPKEFAEYRIKVLSSADPKAAAKIFLNNSSDFSAFVFIRTIFDIPSGSLVRSVLPDWAGLSNRRDINGQRVMWPVVKGSDGFYYVKSDSIAVGHGLPYSWDRDYDAMSLNFKIHKLTRLK